MKLLKILAWWLILYIELACILVENITNASKSSIHSKYHKRVAFTVVVTSDGAYLDSVLVLKKSIEIAMVNSTWDINYVAIILKEAVQSQKIMERDGWDIRVMDTPVKTEEIEYFFLRDTIDDSGCCGIAELLKLRAYQLGEFDKVVLMDMDMLLLNSIDHLLEDQVEMQFTYDKAMDTNSTAFPPVQGGFFVLSPNQRSYDFLVDIFREGAYYNNSGWGGLHIGWHWGGQTIQGVMSYYYNAVTRNNRKVLDSCVHDTMDSTPDCPNTSFDDIYSFHFTICQKPWDCEINEIPLCSYMHDQWWRIRRIFETENHLPHTARCHKFKYEPIHLPE